MTIDRPVLFLGTTRSGKSMVGQQLAALPEFSLAFEPLTTWEIGSTRGRAGRQDDARDASEATPEVTGQIRREIERYLERSGGTRYLDDLPHHALRVAFCSAVLPEARFIAVYRDGRASISEMLYGWRFRDSIGKVWGRRMGGSHRQAVRLSRLPRQGVKWMYNYVRLRSVGRRRTWGPTVPDQHAYAKNHTLVETVAYQWATLVESTRKGVAALPADRVLELRFEEIHADGATNFARVADFCEVRDCDRDRFIRDAVEAIDPRRSRYAEPLTVEEEAEIAPIIGPLQEMMGYDRGA